MRWTFAAYMYNIDDIVRASSGYVVFKIADKEAAAAVAVAFYVCVTYVGALIRNNQVAEGGRL